MFGVGHWPELIVILGVVLIFVGPKRLPEIGGSLGRAIHEFRSEHNGIADRGPGEVSDRDPITQTGVALPARNDATADVLP